ncbi:MAG: hypothetical protein IPH45_18480 [Bacteroidales bacterium]|nr:hypothetical protein [Bacteroidales bacterium]
MKNRFFRTRFICVFIMLYLFVNWSAYSQNDPMKIKQNMIYLEAGGMGGYGSINYERFVFIRQHLAFSVRAGFSTVHWRDFTNTINPDLLFPIAINACLGNDHKLEMGIGQTFTSIIQASPNDFQANQDCRTTYKFPGWLPVSKNNREEFSSGWPIRLT